MPEKLKQTIEELGKLLAVSPELQDKMIAYGTGLADGKVAQDAEVRELKEQLAEMQAKLQEKAG